MEFDPRDQDIIKLLTKLKAVNPEYPEHMLVARRQSYLKQMTAIGLGLSGGLKSKDVVKNLKPPHVLPAAGLLETALLVVMLVEAGALAYFYRTKLADFFQTFTKRSQTAEVTPPSTVAVPTSLQVQGVSPSPAITSTAITQSPSETAVVTGTPIPGMAGENSIKTPDPTGNNGHHYGQTPKPLRTKENNGNNNKPPQGNNDKPPSGNPTKSK